MNDSKIKVLLVEPEKYPKEIVIDDSLEAVSYTHLRVLEILKECPMSRYDDMLLILHYYNRYGYIPAGNLPLEDIVSVSYTHLDVYKRQILHHEEGVDLLPANLELSAMEYNLMNAMSRETTCLLYTSRCV